MFKNKKFVAKSMPILILGLFYMFFYSGLQNDHINVITPYLMKAGWTAEAINNPITVAGYVVIIFYLACGAGMIKFGPVKFMVPSSIILGLATAGVGLSESLNSYALYAVCLFLVRLLVVPLQMGGFMLCANWFIKYRGRALGWVTIGSPLFSICGIAIFTAMTNAFNLQFTYIGVGAVVLVIAILTLVLVKDKPEDVGLYPDGSLTPTHDQDDSESITLKQLVSESRAWKLIISYGILQFVIVGMMAFMIVRYTFIFGEEGLGPVFLWLAIGAGIGIPMSYVLGWIDDKLGSIKASLILNILYFIAVIPLAVMNPDSPVALIGVWAFGVACMTGGMPTMHPAVTSYVYGRKKYQSANKWIMTIQAVIMAFAIPYMVHFVGAAVAAGAAAGGPPDYTKMTPAYIGMIIMLVISLITILTMFKIPDANLADREYGQEEENA
ncbi:MAG: MFS transporter [Clostridiales Family XIII bacterium]|jgi:MFS family permease|nr:MFS transporter [Clostridiales Family XIII bacterium]